MNELTAVEYMLKQLTDERSRAAASVLSGRVSMEEYHRLCGVLQGLNYAEELIKSTIRMVAEEEDDG